MMMITIIIMMMMIVITTVIMIVNLIYTAQFETNGVLTELCTDTQNMEMHHMDIICGHTGTCILIHMYKSTLCTNNYAYAHI